LLQLRAYKKAFIIIFVVEKKVCVEVQLLKMQKLMLPKNQNVTKLAFFLVYRHGLALGAINMHEGESMT
jgi:hypothetical protein